MRELTSIEASNVTSSANRRLYSELVRHTSEHRSFTYGEFESSLLKDVCLFNVPSDAYMQEVEDTLDAIIRALPSFKRVFSRPIIRLEDEHQIVPVEAVKMIDNRTLTHVASRSELWENLTHEGIKPRKLMTLEHVETYSIYENIAFAAAVDSILAYIKNTLVRIKDVVYGCRDIHFNLLDRTHHKLYFLAVGKLYFEYVSSRLSEDGWSRCVDKMMFIDKTLRSKLNSPVYKHCKRKNYTIKLKKTNIFRSHKDYAEVYKILKIFESGLCSLGESAVDISVYDGEYKEFCRLISLFAAGHFNYSFDDKARIDTTDFFAECKFLDWKLSIREMRADGYDLLKFTTQKDVEYTTCLVFGGKGDVSTAALERIRQTCGADECILCTPTQYGDRDLLYLSIFDIDSFRRIQQILLRGMIYSDKERSRCPFCGSRLTQNGSVSSCKACNGEVTMQTCPETDKVYFISDIASAAQASGNAGEAERRRFLHDRLSESRLHFRNITQITDDGAPICPHCKKTHKN